MSDSPLPTPVSLGTLEGRRVVLPYWTPAGVLTRARIRASPDPGYRCVLYVGAREGPGRDTYRTYEYTTRGSAVEYLCGSVCGAPT